MKRIISSVLVVLMMFMLLGMAFAESTNATKRGVESIVRVYQEAENEALGIGLYSTGTAVALGGKGDAVKYFVTARHCVEGTWETISYGEMVSIFGRNRVQEIIGELNYVEGVEVCGNEALGVLFFPSANQFYLRFDVVEGSLHVIYDSKDNWVPATVHKMSDDVDLAIIELNTPISERMPASYLKFNVDKDDLRGKRVTALGFPGSSDYSLSDETNANLFSSKDQVVAKTGVISRVVSSGQTRSGAEEIEHDAQVNHGNSGGPIVDENGVVLGINDWVTTDGTDAFFAISSNEVIRLCESNGIPIITAHIGNPLLWIIIGVLAAALIAVGYIMVFVKKKPDQKKAAAGAKRTLVGASGAMAGKAFPIQVGTKTVIGTDGTKCGIVYPAGTGGVSRVHCSVTFDGSIVTVTDEGSSYGTYIDDTKLTKGQSMALHRGHRLYLGSKNEVFELHS